MMLNLENIMDDNTIVTGSAVPSSSVTLPPQVPIITQADLARHQELLPLFREYRKLDAKIKDQLEEGLTVEVGRLRARLTIHHRRRMLLQYILDALGLNDAEIKELRENVPLIPYRYLHIRPVSFDKKRQSRATRAA
jgi:hypothetical protein